MGRRGHKELAKGRRVAVSFRLWGDPELRLLPGPLGRPQGRRFGAPGGPDTLVIRIPDERLPEARSNKYVARMFPGSQAAGMVKPIEGGADRRLTPVYFFRQPLPSEWSFGGRGPAVPPVRGVEATGPADRSAGALGLCGLLSGRGAVRRVDRAGVGSRGPRQAGGAASRGA